LTGAGKAQSKEKTRPKKKRRKKKGIKISPSCPGKLTKEKKSYQRGQEDQWASKKKKSEERDPSG